MEVMAGLIVFLIAIVIAFFVMLIPTWIVMLAYNYIVELMGRPTWEIPITILSVLCVTLILATLRGIFSRRS